MPRKKKFEDLCVSLELNGSRDEKMIKYLNKYEDKQEALKVLLKRAMQNQVTLEETPTFKLNLTHKQLDDLVGELRQKYELTDYQIQLYMWDYFVQDHMSYENFLKYNQWLHFELNPDFCAYHHARSA